MTLSEWLYDPTPITAEWLVEIGGKRDGEGDCEFGDESWAVRDRSSWGLSKKTKGGE